MSTGPTAIGRAIANVIRRDRGSSLLFALSILWGGVKLMHRLGQRKKEVVYRTKLAPGEGIRIQNLLVNKNSSTDSSTES